MDVKDFLGKDRYARLSGIELVETARGHAKARMKISDEHLNAVNIVQGGAIFTLADLAFAAASNSHGTIAVGINATISYIKAARSGFLTAEANETSLHNTLATYTVNVKDDSNDLVAVFHGMVYRKGESF